MTGLVGWWPLNEDSGSTAYDLSGNEYHGTLNGGVTQGIAGKGGLTSYSFDGNDDYVSVGNFPHNVANFSAFVWVKIQTSPDTGQYAVRQRVDSNNNWGIGYRPDGDGNTEGFIAQSNRSEILEKKASEGEWHHIGFSSDEDRNAVAFWDGEAISNFKMESSSGVAKLSFGGNYGRSRSIDAVINNVFIYNRALSSEEAKKLYEWGSGDFARALNDQNCSSTVSRWAFDGDATDSWGNNNGTVNGSLNFTDNAIKGQAANFDGNNDYIQTPLTSIPSKVSFSFWMRHSESTSGSKVLSGVFDGSVSYQLQFNDGGYSWASYDGSSFHGIRNGPQVALGQWVHVCAVYNGSDYILYENGGQIDRKADDFYGNNVSGVNIPIGAQSDSGGIKEYFEGIIDDFRIYSKALSPEEIFELYRWGTRGRDMRKLTVNAR